MINAIAIDDEPPALSVIEHFCSQVESVDLQKTFTRPTEALKYLKKFPVDLLFLDIQMPSLNGIDFYKEVKQDTMVIFTTAHTEYAVEGFNLNAIDYLLKPYSFERFQQAVNKANEYFSLQHQASNVSQENIYIRADYSLLKIPIADIVYIESLRDYLKIRLVSNKNIVTRMTMKSITDKLPAKEFIRVHRSYIVPLSKIRSVRNKMISVAELEIPIGSSYEEDFFKRFSD
jgi:DNA-binding LytR/AlgR family response regulator